MGSVSLPAGLGSQKGIWSVWRVALVSLPAGLGVPKKEFGAFGVFEAWQTAGLNAKKKLLMWPAGLGVPKRHLERLEGGFGVFACGVGMPLLPWEATKEPSSTPPVVPGAAPALAKAGAGGYYI